MISYYELLEMFELAWWECYTWCQNFPILNYFFLLDGDVIWSFLSMTLCSIQDLEKRILSFEEEAEIVSAITFALNSVPDKELKRSSLARLLSLSYVAVEKLVCFLMYCNTFFFLQWLIYFLFYFVYINVIVTVIFFKNLWNKTQHSV